MDGRGHYTNNKDHQLAFRLWPNATLTIHEYFSEDGLDGNDNSNNVERLLWSKSSLRKTSLVSQCLHNPLLDCPYFHLHANGDVVINYIDNNTPSSLWKARQAHDVYFDFYSTIGTTPANVKTKHVCAPVYPNMICLGDRMGGEMKLRKMRALCNHDFMFGWTAAGVPLRKLV